MSSRGPSPPFYTVPQKVLTSSNPPSASLEFFLFLNPYKLFKNIHLLRFQLRPLTCTLKFFSLLSCGNGSSSVAQKRRRARALVRALRVSRIARRGIFGGQSFLITSCRSVAQQSTAFFVPAHRCARYHSHQSYRERPH